MTKQFMLDISSYQSGITVQQIKASGAKAVVIKLTESTNYTNPYIAQQIKVCKQAGIKHIHFYHFQRATNVSGLAAEAKYCISVAKQFGYQGSFIFLDAELKEAVPTTEAINAFYKVVRDAGYRAGFYTYQFMYSYFNRSVFTGCDGVWAAAYPLGNQATDQSPNMGYFPSIENCVAWQFTDNWCGMHIDCSYTLTDALLKTSAPTVNRTETYLHSKRAKKVIPLTNIKMYDGLALSKAKVIGEIPEGVTVPVIEYWEEGKDEHDLVRLKVEYNGKQGWISGNDKYVKSAYWLADSYGKGSKTQVRMLRDDWIYKNIDLQGEKFPIKKGDVFTIEVNTTDPAGYPRLKTSFGLYVTALKSFTEWI